MFTGILRVRKVRQILNEFEGFLGFQKDQGNKDRLRLLWLFFLEDKKASPQKTGSGSQATTQNSAERVLQEGSAEPFA